MNKFVWLDMEMTGLDPVLDKILEIAVIVTDSDLNIVDEFEPVTIGYKVSQLEFNLGENEAELMDAFKESGLLKRVEDSQLTLQQAEEKLLLDIKKNCKRKQCHLAGSSVWIDGRFLARQMPGVWDFLHYKLLDVTGLKLLRQEWFPEVEEYQKADAHDALTDIKESVEQLKYYREKMFKKEV